MKLALLQINSIWENESANLHAAGLLLNKAAKAGCDVAVLPEMFSTGFTMRLPAVSDGQTVNAFLTEQAKRHNMHILAGVAMKKPNEKRGTNNALFFDRTGRITARYAKSRLFPLADESKAYRSGTKPIVFSICGVSASVFICYDLRFPELFRQVCRDVQIIFVIANWPQSRMNHWEALLRARAIENQCFVAGVNRTGKDGNGIRYAGGSLVVDPMGMTIAQLDSRIKWAVVEIDPSRVTEMRARYPFLPQ